MRANDILDDQIIVKKGRLNGFGFEPLWNSYFDFYLDSRYFEEPLLELGDVTFHLFLRKNLNDRNPRWKMPTIRQISKKFKVGNGKIYAMLNRLAKAHLLNKESGTRQGIPNERNAYILSDPISTLGEFLEVAHHRLFRFPLLPEYVIEDEACYQNGNMVVAETETPHVTEMETHKQTSFKQTSEKQIDPLWKKTLTDFKMQMPPKTFEMFLEDTDFVSIEEGTAVISTTRNYAKDWVENRLGSKIARVLNVNSVRCVVLTE